MEIREIADQLYILIIAPRGIEMQVTHVNQLQPTLIIAPRGIEISKAKGGLPRDADL